MAVRPLTMEEVRSALQGRPKLPRLPLLIHFWVHPEAFDTRRQAVEQMWTPFSTATSAS